MITPVNGNFLVEPMLRTEIENKELKDRMAKSGLLVPDAAGKPDNKNKFEGVPNQGVIRHIPESYKGELKVGQMIVFAIESPSGLKWEDKTLFAVKADQIVAVITE